MPFTVVSRPGLSGTGPGVPATPRAGQAELTAQRIWQQAPPAGKSRRWARAVRVSGWALTLILLAASGFLLYSRFHHAPFQVTGVSVTQQTTNGCEVEVTGRITTNGSAGKVSYQWLFRPPLQPPQPLSQSVVAGQRAVYVAVALEGQGHGSTARTVTLQVLSPDARGAPTVVVITCP